MANIQNGSSELEAVKALHKALDAKFAENIVVLDLQGVTPIADYFVIATGGSAPQLAALAETTEETMAKQAMHLIHREGVQSSNWMLLDFGSVVVHLFDRTSRDFYNLERTWGDGKILAF